MAGKFFVSRSIFKHPIFAGGEYSRRDAWLWMVAEARWKRVTIMIAGRPFVLKRGQFRHSLRHMAGQFGWTTGKLQRFLEKLRGESMIDTNSDTGQLIVTIRNYDEYQSDGRQSDTPGDTRRDTPQGPIHPAKATDTPDDTPSDTPQTAHLPQISDENHHSNSLADTPCDTGSEAKPIQQPIQREIRGKKEEGIPTTTTYETRSNPPDQRDGGGKWSMAFFAWADERMREAAGGCLNSANPNLEVKSDLIAWLEAGADFDLDVLPAIRSKAQSLGEDWNHQIGNWGFFARAVAGAKARRCRSLPAPEPQYERPTTQFIDPNDLFSGRSEEVR